MRDETFSASADVRDVTQIKDLAQKLRAAHARQAQKPEGGLYFTEPEARLLRLLANYLKRSYASADEVGKGLRLLIERTKL